MMTQQHTLHDLAAALDHISAGVVPDMTSDLILDFASVSIQPPTPRFLAQILRHVPVGSNEYLQLLQAGFSWASGFRDSSPHGETDMRSEFVHWLDRNTRDTLPDNLLFGDTSLRLRLVDWCVFVCGVFPYPMHMMNMLECHLSWGRFPSKQEHEDWCSIQLD